MKASVQLGILAGIIFATQKFWSVIERPVIEFVFLGIIPGTNIVLGFGDILLLGFTSLLGVILIPRIDFAHHVRKIHTTYIHLYQTAHLRTVK